MLSTGSESKTEHSQQSSVSISKEKPELFSTTPSAETDLGEPCVSPSRQLEHEKSSTESSIDKEPM